MTDDVVDLCSRRILRAAEASRRAGYRVTPPLDADADRWVCSIQAGEDEDGHPVHRVVWSPRKAAEDWQHARFGPFSPMGERHRAIDKQESHEESADMPEPDSD